MHLTVCSCHATYAFQREFTHYSWRNVKELLDRSRRKMWSLSDCNWTRTQNYLVRKRTLNHLAKLAKWLSFVQSTYLYGAFDCMFLSCHDKYIQLISIILHLSRGTLCKAFANYKKSWILFLNSNLSLFTQIVCVRVIYSGSCRRSARKVAVLLFSWSTWYIAFWKSRMSVDFNLSLRSHTSCWILLFPEILGALSKKQWYSSFGATTSI